MRRRCLRSLATSVALWPILAPGLSEAQGPAAAPSFDRGRRDLPKLALTFDGGSDAGQSARILDALELHGVTATFFLTGEYIRRNPLLVRRLAAAGHEVGNHTWSHPHLTEWDRTHRHDTLPGRDRRFLLEELRRTAEAYESLTGRRMSPIWRAPYGEVNAEILAWAAGDGWSHVGWTRDDAGGRHTLDSLDWVADRRSRNYLSSAQITDRILSFGRGRSGLNGGVVLMHLSVTRDDPGADRLGDLAAGLRADGYRLVTVSELQRDAAPPGRPLTLAAALQRDAR